MRDEAKGAVLLLGAACAGAGLLAAAIPPVGVAATHWVAYVPLLVALRGRGAWAGVLSGLTLGFVLHLLVCAWMRVPLTEMLGLSDRAATSVLLGFCLVSAVPWAAMFGAVPLLRRALGDRWPLPWATAWLACELVWSRLAWIPLSQGVSQLDHLALWQLASVAGTGGLTVLLVLANAALAEVVRRPGTGVRAAARRLVPVAAAVGLVAAWGHARIARLGPELEAGPKLRVLLVQSDRDMAWRSRQSEGDLLAWWSDLARSAPREALDLVVLPEAAVATDWDRPAFLGALWALSDELGADLIVGTGSLAASPSGTFNAVLHLARPTAERARSWQLDRVVDRVRDTVCRGGPPSAPGPWNAHELAAVARAVGPSDPCRATLDEAIASAEASGGPDAAFLAEIAGTVPWDVYAAARALLLDVTDERFERLDDGAVWRLHGGPSTSPLTVRCAVGRGCRVVGPVHRYDKSVPLPLGEARSAAVEAVLGTGRASLRPGPGPVTFEVAGGLRVATPICYEAILEGVCAAFADPDLFVNVANDAWFGATAGSELHAMLVSARAVELGRTVVRAAHSGVSFVVDPLGRRSARAALWERSARIVEVPVTRVPAAHRRIGSGGVLALLASACVPIVAGRRRGRRAPGAR